MTIVTSCVSANTLLMLSATRSQAASGEIWFKCEPGCTFTRSSPNVSQRTSSSMEARLLACFSSSGFAKLMR